MAKKAYLVSFLPTTRVIVDVDDDSLSSDKDFEKVLFAARDKIKSNIDGYLDYGNFDKIQPDYESPYDPETDD